MDIHDALRDGLAPVGARAPGDQRPLTEADFARSYVTHSELFGPSPTWELFFDRLRDIGLQSVMASLSFINSVLYVKGGIQAQREIVSNTFDSDLMARLSRLPDLANRVVYSPGQTLLVIRSALLHSPNREDNRRNAQYGRAITEVLLMANDLLDADLKTRVEAATAGATDPDVLARALLSHSIRTTLVNGADAYNTTLARASLIFGDLAAREDVRARAGGTAVDVAARFTAETGLSLRDYFALGWMLM
ncbi:hypothetical protein BH24ACI4_BH24ACI4_30230 [soil metagenome]